MTNEMTGIVVEMGLIRDQVVQLNQNLKSLLELLLEINEANLRAADNMLRIGLGEEYETKNGEK